MEWDSEKIEQGEKGVRRRDEGEDSTNKINQKKQNKKKLLPVIIRRKDGFDHYVI